LNFQSDFANLKTVRATAFKPLSEMMETSLFFSL